MWTKVHQVTWWVKVRLTERVNQLCFLFFYLTLYTLLYVHFLYNCVSFVLFVTYVLTLLFSFVLRLFIWGFFSHCFFHSICLFLTMQSLLITLWFTLSTFISSDLVFYLFKVRTFLDTHLYQTCMVGLSLVFSSMFQSISLIDYSQASVFCPLS